MSSLPENPVEGALSSVMSVAELNRRVSRLLERSVPLVWVAGEISNYTRAASGHWYFSLKDAEAQVRCIMFRGTNRLVDWRPVEGDQVEVRALAGLYAARGDFQLTVETMRRAGAGALYEAFLRTKEKLGGEGMFDVARKRPLPSFPKVVGVVTSLQAAALGDVLTTLKRRAGHLRVVIYPTAVQGKDAPAQLIDAIGRASTRGEIDVLLVVRGGGSIEDLSAYNDEGVARALACLSVPWVAGIGHETDVTIADFVADVRAATPTAAAELVSPDGPRLRAHIEEQSGRARRAMQRQLQIAEQRLDDVQRRLKSPQQRLVERIWELSRLAQRLRTSYAKTRLAQAATLAHLGRGLRRARLDLRPFEARLDHLVTRLHSASAAQRQANASHLRLLAARLQLLDPHAALRRGYAMVENAAGQVVDDAAKLRADDLVHLKFARGQARAQVISVKHEEPG